jgi:hypothetical protein
VSQGKQILRGIKTSTYFHIPDPDDPVRGTVPLTRMRPNDVPKNNQSKPHIQKGKFRRSAKTLAY